ncbi:DHA2 family efflux MFS transporter permease subunit [Zoogloea dura]|uniref:Multidrug efflux MFS transporter n=1 Tax=Zoogloea dura TaxID=2728840 RepID=A0A848G9P3_9RHOO|nr:DHA2 family efflux MFS transporter permease subunit [Zoogloea dura]NML28199.1 multidrug efflux MFS transporter [Zoogloea dura]
MLSLLLPVAPSRDELFARHGERYRWLALLTVAIGVIAAVLATTSFSVAVPAMGAYWGMGQDRVQWVITGYMAAMTVAMLPTPWLLERYGFRRVFLGTVLFLGLTSLAGALVSDFAGTVAIRLLQGAAAGVQQPLSMVVVMRLFPPGRQGRATGLLSFGIVLAPAVAPTLAGVLLEHFGWQSIFLLSVPFCLLAGLLAAHLLPRADDLQRRPFDWYGVILLSVMTLVLIEWVASLREAGPLATWSLVQSGIALLSAGLFVRHAGRAVAPIFSLELFRERAFAMGILVSFAYGVGVYASSYLIPVFLQNALGFGATPAGLALMPSGFVLAATIPLAGVVADRHSPRWITVAGLLVFGLSFLYFGLRGSAVSYAEILWDTMIGRVGLGLIIPALTLATLRHLQPRLMGEASMVNNYVRQLGGVLGIAIVAVFVEWRITVYGVTPRGIDAAYSEAFLLLTATFLLATVAALRMKPRE